MDYSRYGEEGLRVVFGSAIDLDTHEKVRRYYFFLRSLCLGEIIDIIPSFTACLVRFNGELITFEGLLSFLQEREGEMDAVPMPPPVVHEIPVLYGGEYGPDMDFVTSYSGLTDEQVIDIHTATAYTVYMVGFMPGFPYLGPLDRRIYVPRLETPRLKVPEGSVGLAQLQTGIYPFESPGGWQIIGKTETQLFDWTGEPYSLLKIGDLVRFVRV
jgi:inhibitor of KinA